MQPSPKIVLILDRDDSFLRLYRYLVPENLKLIETTHLEEAIKTIANQRVDLVICDDSKETDIDDILLIRTFLNQSFNLVVVSGAFHSTYQSIISCYAFISKNELKNVLKELLKDDSPIWESNTVKT